MVASGPAAFGLQSAKADVGLGAVAAAMRPVQSFAGACVDPESRLTFRRNRRIRAVTLGALRMVEIGTWQVIGLVAGSSVLAAALNQGVTLVSGMVTRERDKNFGRLYLALSLEEYASTCSDVISQSEAYEASDQAAGSPQAYIPPLAPYPETVNWTVLGLAATNRLLAFRVEVEAIRAQIRDSLEHDVQAGVEETRTYSAAMGLKALNIARTLRTEAGAPLPVLDLEWSIEEYLDSKHDQYIAERRTRSAAAARG